MEVFDKVSQKTIDRRDQQLSFLALFMVVVLGGGMALMMYPTVFNREALIPVAPSRTLFFGFCALCILMVLYLINRMRVVKTLRSSLVEEREQSAKILQQSSSELLGTLLGFSHFQDRLTMDFRRAAQVNEPLSLLLVQVKPAKPFAEGPEKEVALGDAAASSAASFARRIRSTGSPPIFLASCSRGLQKRSPSSGRSIFRKVWPTPPAPATATRRSFKSSTIPCTSNRPRKWNAAPTKLRPRSDRCKIPCPNAICSRMHSASLFEPFYFSSIIATSQGCRVSVCPCATACCASRFWPAPYA